MRINFLAGTLTGFMALLILAASPSTASAHVIVWARPSVVNSPNAIFSINAAAESTTSGIAKIEVTGPPGFDASNISIQNGPPGWTASNSGTPRAFTISAPSGSGLNPKEDLFVSVNIKQLPPDTKSLFKVKQTYSDGFVQNWADDQTPGKELPPFPQAALYLEPKAPPPGATSAVGSQPAETPNSTSTASPPSQKSDLNTGLAIVLVIALGTLLFVVFRSRAKRHDTEKHPGTTKTDI